MRAWMKHQGRLMLREAALPVPKSDELLVKVAATSLNRGELRQVSRAGEGFIPGWDVAGTVERAASTGAGPAAGARVAAVLEAGAWAEYVAVPAAIAAVVPPQVSMSAAATLPLAGLTALAAVQLGSPIIGRRALVTGASGGVGRMFTRLAALAGAEVTAICRAEHSVRLRELGAASTVASIEDATGEFDVTLESVGGSSLRVAVEKAARRGLVVTIGNSSEADSSLNARSIYHKGGVSLYGLMIFEEVESRRIGSRELAYLLGLVERGILKPDIALEAPWAELDRTLDALQERRVSGKAVLTL
jgi:NADPH2:quinone reductase